MRGLGKRGDVDVQFNWVFVFIVGALILAIAVGFVTTQKKNSDTIISQQIMRYTRSVITHSLSTSGKIENLTLQKTIGASCSLADCRDSGCVSSLFVFPKSPSVPTYIEPIFSPTTIKGNQMLTETAEFDLPFHVINLIYLTSDTSRYILIGDAGSIADEMYQGLPESIRYKELIASSGLAAIKDRNNDKVKLVFFDSNPSLPANLEKVADSNLGAIKVMPTDGSNQGSIQFYRKRGSSLQAEGAPVPYIGKALLYGAIFSENLESYSCNLKKCLIRLGVVSQSYRAKLGSLKVDNNVGVACVQYYNEAFDLLDPTGPMIQPTFSNILDIPPLAQQLKSRNDALKTKSCPVIY